MALFIGGDEYGALSAVTRPVLGKFSEFMGLGVLGTITTPKGEVHNVLHRNLGLFSDGKAMREAVLHSMGGASKWNNPVHTSSATGAAMRYMPACKCTVFYNDIILQL